MFRLSTRRISSVLFAGARDERRDDPRARYQSPFSGYQRFRSRVNEQTTMFLSEIGIVERNKNAQIALIK